MYLIDNFFFFFWNNCKVLGYDTVSTVEQGGPVVQERNRVMISMPVAKFTMNVLEITVRCFSISMFLFISLLNAPLISPWVNMIFFFKCSRSFLKRQFSSNSKFHNHFYNLSKVSNFNLSQSKVKGTNQANFYWFSYPPLIWFVALVDFL